MKQPHIKMLLLLNLILIFFFSCNSSHETKQKDTPDKTRKIFSLVSPGIDQVYVYTDSIQFEITSLKKNIKPDSTLLYVNGNMLFTEVLSPLIFVGKSMFNKTGRQEIRIKIFYNDSLTQSLTTKLIVLSDIEPVVLSYKVIKKIPHDPVAYIQGLFMYNGNLYESTGLPKKSRLMKIDPETGNIIMDRHLGDKFFGEGITRWKDHIYQLTWEQKVGFVYDINTFEQVREFDLQTMEGWGLTSDDKSLIVSDGSSVLYFYDPDYFSQINQLDVCDNLGLVTRLNELEYVNGDIWANVYGEPYIIKIDAETGKVLAKIDLEALYPKGIARDLDHTLNGIAHTPKNTFFVTGKLWPVMYEVEIIE
jgi:glutamine cyclotransferase